MFGFVVLGLLVVLSVAAPVVAPHPQDDIDVLRRLLPPAWDGAGSREYLLGTDQLGRDVLTRIIWGSRVSLVVGLSTAIVTVIIGVTVGLVAGYYAGVVDEILMRVADVLLAFPFVLLAMVVIVVLGPSLPNLILVLSVFGWVGYARVVRATTLAIKEREFVEAARTVGATSPRIIWRHILPNVFAPAIVIATFVASSAIIAEAALSFLGLGLPTAIPSWGAMLADGRDNLVAAPWLTWFPGLAIMITVLSLNLVGDWLRDYLDPRLRV
jgi:peptide/nickel transport system permease protein